ncbi:RNA polymerase sigma factor [Rheinheimera riviphila]|uniref:RNA polymerase sigma factor n=1 Tax=Rheinheimera riviphila TaxID=1834037 RepID=A0A437R0S4_9GAMM|nr:RNA polymerase sigma factor [Rheinheimera riviphila]RVU40369.1 RNA polymerase sigma factor [Rheinheimera riviphila]
MLQEQELLDCYQALERPLYNVLYRMLWHAQDCQDLVQEAFLKVWQQRKQVDAATLHAYVYTTALNLARNKIRWRLNWVFDSVEPWLESWFSAEQMGRSELAKDSPEYVLQMQQQQQVLRKALASLASVEREVLLLTEYSELTLAETAQVLSIAPGTVASRRARALKQLKAKLEQQTGRAWTDED